MSSDFAVDICVGMRGRMSLLSCIVKGLVIGLIFGTPIGAVGMLTVQRVLAYGRRAGLISGLGSSVADCMYACVGAFSVTLVSDFLIAQQRIINFVGGLLILAIGLNMIFSKREIKEANATVSNKVMMFVSSFMLGLTNPAIILTFLFAFSYFRIAGKMNFISGVGLVSGVFAGTMIWWIALALFVGRLKERAADHGLITIQKVFGVVLALFSIVVFVKALW